MDRPWTDLAHMWGLVGWGRRRSCDGPRGICRTATRCCNTLAPIHQIMFCALSCHPTLTATESCTPPESARAMHGKCGGWPIRVETWRSNSSAATRRDISSYPPSMLLANPERKNVRLMRPEPLAHRACARAPKRGLDSAARSPHCRNNCEHRCARSKAFS